METFAQIRIKQAKEVFTKENAERMAALIKEIKEHEKKNKTS